MLTVVPFSGFYCSQHSEALDNELEQMIQDDHGNPVSQRIANELWAHVTYPYSEYSRRYVEDFATYFYKECGIRCPLKFESVRSPREYNFQTDRVFAKISRATVRTLWKHVDREKLDAVCRAMFTSCDGFSSYYSPDYRTWGKVDKWDHNQVSALLRAFIKQYFADEWEWFIVEDWSGSGILSNWMYDGLDAEGKRLVNIADYLRRRQERKYRR